MNNIFEKLTPAKNSRESIEKDLIRKLESRYCEVKVWTDGEVKKVTFATAENAEVTMEMNELVDQVLKSFTVYNMKDVQKVFDEEMEKERIKEAYAYYKDLVESDEDSQEVWYATVAVGAIQEDLLKQNIRNVIDPEWEYELIKEAYAYYRDLIESDEDIQEVRYATVAVEAIGEKLKRLDS